MRLLLQIVQFLELAETARQAADKGWGGDTMKFRASAYNNTAKVGRPGTGDQAAAAGISFCEDTCENTMG